MKRRTSHFDDLDMDDPLWAGIRWSELVGRGVPDEMACRMIQGWVRARERYRADLAKAPA